MKQIPSNGLGLTKYGEWSSDARGDTLIGQLEMNSVPYREIPIEHLVGWDGSAYLVHYRSPKTGQPVTVLCVPHRYEIDSFGEEYFYFEGMTLDTALASETWWLDTYEAVKKLVSAR